MTGVPKAWGLSVQEYGRLHQGGSGYLRGIISGCIATISASPAAIVRFWGQIPFRMNKKGIPKSVAIDTVTGEKVRRFKSDLFFMTSISAEPDLKSTTQATSMSR